ncbi:MAG TPA: ABC transporter permease [Terracidiphilus sp.]|jgi:ABC-2 type transport system permease protein|nr:ABC transporter permease [Terracidiphilus sp.]
MHNMTLIARREYLEQVRGRAFRMTTIGVPAIFAVIIGVGYLSSLGIGSNRHMAVAASDPVLAQEIRNQLVGDKDAKARVDVVAPATQAQRDQLVNEVKLQQLDGVLWVDTPQGKPATATYSSPSSGDFITGSRLKSALTHAMLDAHLTADGMNQRDADTLVDGVAIQTFQVKKDGSVVKSNAEASFWKGYVMAILLSMTTMIYGMNVARSIIQEKTSRIFEVMLAIAKPGDLLAGKLIGVGAVGLTQIAIWLLAGGAILFSPLAAAVMTGEFAVHVTWTEAILFPVYFVLGYLLYSSLFAGLAATCETEQELQMYMPLAAAPTWLSFALIVLIINDSNSFWSIAASLFPPTAPIIMFLRMASEIPPMWQFAASIGLMVASILGVLWFSTRLYRVGILMYGKRATLPELMRWLKYS